MNETRRISKRVIWIAVIVLLFGGTWLYWDHIKYILVRNKVHDAVLEKTKGLYQVHYDSLFFDEVGGTLHIGQLRLVPDTAMYAEMIRKKTNPSVLLSIEVPQVNVLRVQTPKALLSKEISAGKIEISHATIVVETSEFLEDTTTYSPGKEIYQEILGQLKSIKMDSIQINHSKLVVRDFGTGRTRFTGTDFSILLTDLLIDSIQKDDSSRILFSRNLELGCQEISIPSKDKKYLFTFQGIGYTSQLDAFSIRHFSIAPQLSEPDFAAAAKLQKDRYDFQIEGISLHHINRQALLHKRLETDSLIISKSSFKIFRDLSYPHDSVNRVGKYPHQEWLQIPLLFAVNKIIVRNSFVEYKEKNAKSHESGKVQFYHVSATLENMTNISQRISSDNRCLLDFRSSFLNKAVFHAKLTMFMKSEEGKFNIEGSLSSIDGQDLNPLLEPMALARLDKGKINKVDFHFTGDNHGCRGPAVVLYDGVKLSMLKKDMEEDDYKKKGLVSFAANLIVKNSNPQGDQTRLVNPEYKRDVYRSIFNLMWKTLFTGIKETAGIK